MEMAARDGRPCLCYGDGLRDLHQLFDESLGDFPGRAHFLMHKRSLVENGFDSVQGGDVITLEELADRYLVAPLEGLFQGHHTVGSVVPGIVFELLATRTETLEGVVMVVGDAGAEDVDER